MKKNKRGRPKKEPTVVIRVPVEKLDILEEMLGRPLARDQDATVHIRIPVRLVDEVKERIKRNCTP